MKSGFVREGFSTRFDALGALGHGAAYGPLRPDLRVTDA